MAQKVKTVQEVLDVAVDTTGDCWIWKRVVVRGYGQLTNNKQIYRAHRFVYEALVRGHELSGGNLYLRKDRTGRYCRACMKIREGVIA